MAMEFITPMVITVAFFSLIGYLAKTIVDGRRRRERIKVLTEFHKSLLDKIGSAQDLAQFLDSQGGSRFLDSISVERTHVSAPQERLLRSVQIGVVASVMGIGFLQLGAWYPHEDGGFNILGVIVLALGVGFLLSAFAAFRLAKGLGLLEPPRLPALPSEQA